MAPRNFTPDAQEYNEAPLIAKAFEGRWRFTGMPDFNEPVNAYIEFTADGRGSFRFMYSHAAIRAKFNKRMKLPYVAFTWGQSRKNLEFRGRGHAKIWPDGLLIGRFWIQNGNDHVFGAEKVTPRKKKARR